MNKSTLPAFVMTLGLWGIALLALSFMPNEPMNATPGLYEPSGVFTTRQELNGESFVFRSQRLVVTETTS